MCLSHNDQIWSAIVGRFLYVEYHLLLYKLFVFVMFPISCFDFFLNVCASIFWYQDFEMPPLCLEPISHASWTLLFVTYKITKYNSHRTGMYVCTLYFYIRLNGNHICMPLSPVYTIIEIIKRTHSKVFSRVIMAVAFIISFSFKLT